LVEGFTHFLKESFGHELVKKDLLVFRHDFYLHSLSNWLGLIPGFGTIGLGEKGPHGFHVTDPWFRGANADLNMTAGDVLDVLRVLDSLGPANQWPDWVPFAPVCT